ncbi:nitroreductase family protein [Clostridium cylindrosporum]|uniref:Nitroreductase family protein n=1 Tax=Clostridium cylindrosporum DSM 605 TaxID=1121307 RepID=A0A0J8D991_CLOCY|nr:nitroreductase family protein [Clostridium cylindrosporum]KMT22600.1 nitroreductase family protein [Clostridium cylindrosporum DSM 605]
MDFLTLLKSRHSVKSFKDQDVPKEKIQSILESVTLCPSYRNLQSFKVLLITDSNVKGMIEAIIPEDNRGKKGFVEAPFSVVVVADAGASEDQRENKYYMFDGAIVMYNILLAATNEELGSCWIEVENEDELKNALDIPKKYKVIGISPIGYAEDPTGDNGNTDLIDKKSIEEVSYENVWKNELSYF